LFLPYNEFSMHLALTAATCLTPRRLIADPLLLIEDGVIAFVGSRAEIELPRDTRLVDFPGAVLAPGFLDVHIHGGAGYDVMSADSTGLAALESQLARHGVSSYLPTTVTAAVDETLYALDHLAAAIERASETASGEVRAIPIGIHLEGPFLSHAQRGVHPPEHLQPASVALFQRFWEAARGRIRIMTVAAELPGAQELIREAVRCDVCVSLGHSDAVYQVALDAIAAGARQATHTFNAMRALDHRNPGIAAAVLNDARVCAEVIADGIHVAPAMLELLLRVKGHDGVLLVSDATSATGMSDGHYRLGGFEVELRGDRCISGDGRLAGSVLSLDRAVRNVMVFARWDLQDAVRLATLNPAVQLNELPHRGTLVPGSRADIAVLSPAGEVRQTIVCGQGV
jgi:N-acetylglucosamine-6-phosphate deacetylase